MSKQLIEPAHKLVVHLDRDVHKIYLAYQIDDAFSGHLELMFPYDLLGISDPLFHLLGTCGAVFLAQLCLSRNVILDTPTTPEVIDALRPVIRTLYAVRAYREGIRPLFEPTFEIKRVLHNWPAVQFSTNKRAVLLWSGGLDSTLSHVLLEHNGYEVFSLHASHVNVDAAKSELQAVNILSSLLSTSFQTIRVKFDQFFEISSRYSNYAGTFPDINSVPHGRELLLLPVALMHASRLGAGNICFGFENSTWTEQFEYEGNLYSRFDTQSEFCNVNLQKMLHKLISGRISLFSPIAPLTEYKKFRMMLKQYPSLTKYASFCYWGRSCGICRKCALYYLFQRALGMDIIHFEYNPVEKHAPFVVQAMQNWNRATSRDSNFSLAKIVEQGAVRPNEDLLLEYREKVYPQLASLLPTWEADLMTNHPVALLPSDFSISF